MGIDVTVLGAGIFGLSAAWACQAKGAAVRVIDPGGVAAGASGGVVGALAPHAPENWTEAKAFQLESLLAAETFWREVQAISGIDPGYARSGRLQPVTDDAALERALARADQAAGLWRGEADWRVVRADERPGGWTPASASGWLVEDTLSARILPARACESLAAGIVARGGEILREGIPEGAVIHATGWQGLHALGDAMARKAGSGVKGQAVVLRHAAPAGAPQIFADGLHIVPHADGTVAIGSTTEREFEDPAATDAQADALVERAVSALPVLHGATEVARWAGVRPRSVTRRPVLGAWPGRRGHYIANGGFKIGFGVAPGVAEVMAALVCDGADRVPDSFRVEALFR